MIYEVSSLVGSKAILNRFVIWVIFGFVGFSIYSPIPDILSLRLSL